eukprot:11680003-Alexandrium_andersonii.AAC.1
MIARIADWRIADRGWGLGDLETSDPLTLRCHVRIQNLREKRRIMHHSGALGAMLEAVPGHVHFKVRTPEAMLPFAHGGSQ